MKYSCQHCGELIVGHAYRVTSEEEGMTLLDMVVCSLCIYGGEKTAATYGASQYSNQTRFGSKLKESTVGRGSSPPPLAETDPLSPTLAPRPLNDLERHIVGLAMAWFKGVEPAPSDIPTNLGDAYKLLRQLAQGTFGSSTP